MLREIRKFFGGVMMIIAFIFGTVSIGIGFGEPIVITLMMYVLTGIFPLIISLFLLEERFARTFTFSNFHLIFRKQIVRIYVFITIITPIFLNVLDSMKFSNVDRLSRPGDVYFTTISVEWLGYMLVIAGLTAFITFAGIFVLGWKNSNQFLRYTFILSLPLFIFMSVIMNDDFKAINQDGLVINTIGNKAEMSWSEVKHVNLNGSITRDGYTKTSGRSFKWEFEFLLENGETEEFGPFTYSKHNLESSLNIKDLLAEKNISLTTDRLLEEEWNFVQIDMDYEEGTNPESFYSIFQYDPKTGEYYDIQY